MTVETWRFCVLLLSFLGELGVKVSLAQFNSYPRYGESPSLSDNSLSSGRVDNGGNNFGSGYSAGNGGTGNRFSAGSVPGFQTGYGSGYNGVGNTGGYGFGYGNGHGAGSSVGFRTGYSSRYGRGNGFGNGLFFNFFGKSDFSDQDEEKDRRPMLAGRKVMSSPAHYGHSSPELHGLAATAKKGSDKLAQAFFTYSDANHVTDGISLDVHMQSSTPGRYHVVLTTMGAVQRGCTVGTMGEALLPEMMSGGSPSSLWDVFSSQSSRSRLPEGVLDDVELWRNVPKSLHIARLKGFRELKQLAGRGIALCEVGEGNSRSVCKGRIPVCIGLAYSKTEEELGFLELPDTDSRPSPTGPHPPSPPHPPPPHRNNTSDPNNSGRPYYDLDERLYYDERTGKFMDTYSPPPPPPPVDYDPYKNDASREPDNERSPRYQPEQSRLPDDHPDLEAIVRERLDYRLPEHFPPVLERPANVPPETYTVD